MSKREWPEEFIGNVIYEVEEEDYGNGGWTKAICATEADACREAAMYDKLLLEKNHQININTLKWTGEEYEYDDGYKYEMSYNVYANDCQNEPVIYGFGLTKAEALEDTRQTLNEKGESWEWDDISEYFYNEKGEKIVHHLCTEAAYDALLYSEVDDFAINEEGLVCTGKEYRLIYLGEGLSYDPEDFSREDRRLLEKVGVDASLKTVEDWKDDEVCFLSEDNETIILQEWSSGNYYPLLVEGGIVTEIRDRIEEDMTLRSWRIAAGLTVTELASRTGIDRRLLTRYESGESKISNMTLVNALKLARELNLDIDSLEKLIEIEDKLN